MSTNVMYYIEFTAERLIARELEGKMLSVSDGLTDLRPDELVDLLTRSFAV